MSTSLDVVEEAVAKAIAETAATVRADHDYRVDLDAFDPGQTKVQGRADVFGFDTRNANAEYEVATVELGIHHRLADPKDPRAYQATRLADERTMLHPRWWKAMASVFDVLEGPEIEEETSREGHLVSYTARVLLRVQPD